MLYSTDRCRTTGWVGYASQYQLFSQQSAGDHPGILDYQDIGNNAGETGGDAVSMSMDLGYLLSTGIFAVIFFSAVSAQISASSALYWTTIMFSQTLGTALGDWVADDGGFGYTGSMILFGAILLAIAATYFFTSVSRTLLFWAAFIMTRPFGAVVGDFLDKPLKIGGLELSRYSASFSLLAAIVLLIYLSTLKNKVTEQQELDTE